MLLWTALALAGIAAATSSLQPSDDPLLTTLVVLPLADDRLSTIPDCAKYHATIGAATRKAIFALDPPCFARFEEAADPVFAVDDDLFVLIDAYLLDVQFNGHSDSVSVNGETPLSTVLYLHRTTLDTSSPTASSSSGDRTQIRFSAHDEHEQDDQDEQGRLSNWEHDILALKPAGHGHPSEGFLVLLARDGPTAFRQLEFLTTSPVYAHYSLVSIPHVGRPLSTLVDGRFPEVPKKDVDRVRRHLDGLRFSPAISRVLAQVDEKQDRWRLKDDVEMLSGENQEGLREDEKWVSRHSMSEGAPKAAQWLAQKMSAYSFTCHAHHFLPGFAPMLECVYDNSGLGDAVLAEDGYRRDEEVALQQLRGEGIRFGKNETVILSAHYDSRGSFGYATAPGADDDASGTALVLAVARTISQASVRFSRKVVLCLFAGEEQGLLGSAWYAKRLAGAGAGEEGGHEREREDVAMMVQVDMVGYRKEGEPMQLARPDVIGLPEAGWLLGNLSEIYVPELVTGYTAACCSDHQTFVEQAFPASWLFERNGPIADPCYHSSCDRSARPGYSFDQIAAHVKVATAYLLEVGGWAYL